MEKSKIQPIQKSKTIDYSNQKIDNFWLKTDKTVTTKNNNFEQIKAVFNAVQDSVICIQTEELNNSEILEVIFDATKKRNRIYLITNQKDDSLKQLEGTCLIRYGVKNIGSFILINPNTNNAKGIISNTAFTQENEDNFTLNLDKKQIKTLFRFFSDNFWNKAAYEIIDTFENTNKIEEAPLDFLPNINDFCDVDYVTSQLSNINSNAIISIPNLTDNELLDLSKLKKSTILTSLENNDTKLLKTLSTNNTIKANRIVNSRIIINDENNSWLIPKTTLTNNVNLFALKLNNQQIVKLKDLISDRIENSEFEYNISNSRKELENNTILLLENLNTELEIKSKSEIKVASIELKEFLPKNEFENQEPEFIDDGVSVKIDYTWDIIPFYTPKNVKKAKLYTDWEKHQNEYNILINKIEDALNESSSKNIGAKLKLWFIGKNIKISKFKQELDELKSVKLAILENQDRNEVLKTINELAKNVTLNLTEIETEIKKSEIEIEIGNLEKQITEKQNDLEQFIQSKEQELTNKEENREQNFIAFLEKYNIKKDELPKYKSGWQRKKNKKKGKIEEDQKKLNELTELEGFNFRKKFEDEKAGFNKQIKNLQNQIESNKKAIEKINTNKDVSSSTLNYALGNSANKKQNNQDNRFDIPNTLAYLPKVGELFEIGKQKYLEIDYWDDFELGQIEVNRLYAKLSAKNN